MLYLYIVFFIYGLWPENKVLLLLIVLYSMIFKHKDNKIRHYSCMSICSMPNTQAYEIPCRIITYTSISFTTIVIIKKTKYTILKDIV